MMNQKDPVGNILSMVAATPGVNPTFAKAITPDAGLMSVVCALCGRDMGQKMGPTGMIDHGCCKSCADKMEAGMKAEDEAHQKHQDEISRRGQQAILGIIAARLYDIGYRTDCWSDAVDAADAVLNVLDELSMLPTGEMTSVDECKQMVDALKERGPLAVELVEEDRA